MWKSLIIVALLLPLSLLALTFFRDGPWPQVNNPTPPSPYDPAAYGLPPTIAGYKSFAVLASDNTACMPAGEKRLVLQAAEPGVDEFLQAGQSASIDEELRQRGLADFAQAGVMVVGPGESFDQFLNENEKWNQQAHSMAVSLQDPPHLFQ